MWEIEIDGRVEGPLSTEALRARLEAQPALRGAPLRRVGAASWSTAEAEAEAVAAGEDAAWPAAPAQQARGPGDGYDLDQDAVRKRAVWLKWMLRLWVLSAAGLLFGNVLLHRLVQRVRDGDYGPQDALDREALVVDLISGASAALFLLAMLGAVIAYSFWVNRAVRNGWALDPTVMTISPGWAVGWNFIPVASLWMPFRAVLQAWRAATGGSASRIPGVFYLWWFAWILSNALGTASLRYGGFEPDLEQLFLVTQLDIAGSACDVISGLALMVVVGRLTKAQQVWEPQKAFE